MKDLAMFLLNASVQAGWLALALIAVRLMFRKAPKKLLCALWALVGLRLAVPVSLRSVFSLLPSKTPVAASSDVGGVYVQTGLPPVDNTVNSFLQIAAAPAAPTRELAAQTAIDWKTVFAVVWICGVAVMLLYAAVSFLRLRLQVREAVKEEGNVYLCDRVGTPFILGVVRPRIYLPSSLDAGDRAMILLHERAHLKRRDHLWKPLGFLLLSVYWFNPVLWVVYVLLCRDIELACDERVLRQQGSEIKKDYASALLRCSAPRHLVRACPVAFGEVGVKARIKSVLNYKKPAFWVILLALVASAVVAVCFMTTPKDTSSVDRISVLRTGGTDERVYLEVRDLTFYDNTMLLDWELHNDTGEEITFDELYAVSRRSGFGNRTLTPVARTEQDPLGMPSGNLRKNAVFRADVCLTDEFFCEAPGNYRFSLGYRVAGNDDADAQPQQVWFDFRVRPESKKQPAVRVLRTDVSESHFDLDLRIKKIGFRDTDRTELPAELEITNRSTRAIDIVGFEMFYLLSGKEYMLKPFKPNGGTLPQTMLKAGERAVLSVPLHTFPCILPGTYRCMIHYQITGLARSYRPRVSFDFEVLPREDGAARITGFALGGDSSAVQVLPHSVTLHKQTLHTDVTFVNRSGYALEAHEEAWMLRGEDGAYTPLPVKENMPDHTLFFELPSMQGRSYSYTPSAFCDCTTPGDYRFQVHYRFGNEPENSYPHVMWFDFTIPAQTDADTVPLPDGMDDVIHEAILKDNEAGNWSGECATEGHVVYGVEQTGSTWKVYLYHSFERYGFINGCFTVVSGHWSVAVLTMELRDAGFICKQIDYPQDGSYNAPSIKRMFPKKLESRALNPTQSDRDEVTRQCEAQAQTYLKTISRGRDALIVPYDQLDLQLPDLSAQVSNKLSNELGRMEGLYELTLGTREQLEKGVRYVYRTALLHDTNTLLLTKEVYGTDEVRELLLYSAETGDLLYHDGGREQPDELHCFNARVTDKPGQRNRLMMPTREDLFSNGVVVNTETFSEQSSKASEGEYVTVYFNYPVAESSPEQMPYVHAICYMADVYAFGNDPSSTAQTDVAWVPSDVILSFEATVTQARNGGALVKINRDAGTWKQGTEVDLNFAGTQWESLRPAVGTVLHVDYPINAEIAETYPPILSMFHDISVVSIPDGEKTTEKPPEPTTQQRTTTAPPTTTKKSEPTTRTSEPFVPSTTMKTTEPPTKTFSSSDPSVTRAYTPEESAAIDRLGEDGVRRFPDLKNTTNELLFQAFEHMNTYAKFRNAVVSSYTVEPQSGSSPKTVTLVTDKGTYVAEFDKDFSFISDNQ